MSATIEDALRAASKWADIPGVQSVGQGEDKGKPVIRVLVSTEDARRKIPTTFEGYKVLVEFSTPIGIQGR